MYKIAWLAGKTPFECVSTSTDGQVLWWDVRKLAEPTEGLWVEEKTEEKQRVGGTSLEYSGVSAREASHPSAVPTWSAASLLASPPTSSTGGRQVHDWQ